MDSVHGGGLGGTYGGNPVAAAAALGSISEMKEHDLNARAAEIEQIIKGRLAKLQAQHPALADIRGRGAMVAVELCKPGTTEPDADLAKSVAAAAHRAGVIVLTCGTYGNVFRFLPPLTISDELLNEAFDVLEQILGEVA
jgi:4-aminobutyrate aminotransferase/(S)-3-amino-2-methylpropionate transaminase